VNPEFAFGFQPIVEIAPRGCAATEIDLIGA
jgi:hypothetical protein